MRREGRRGPEGQRPASSTKDLTHLTFQCNDCSGENSHDSDCDQRLVPCPYAYPKPCKEKFTFRNLLRDFEMNHGQIEVTLESLIIVYTRNMFFDKISLLHAVIRALHDFRRGASRGAIFFFRPENF